jgi:hypothetical protein
MCSKYEKKENNQSAVHGNSCLGVPSRYTIYLCQTQITKILHCTELVSKHKESIDNSSGQMLIRDHEHEFGGNSQRDPDGAEEGDGPPEQAAQEPQRLPDPVHRVQQLVLAKPRRAR